MRDLKRRRWFLAAGVGATVAARGAAAQQQGKQWRLIILAQGEKGSLMRLRPWTVFFDELRRLGYDEGQNLLVAWHSTEGDDRQVSDLAGQIVRTRPDLVFTPDSRMTAVVQAATNSIPVVAVTDDPVFRGFAASLARPGGNITGIAVGAGSIPNLAAKRVSLLKEAVPTVSKLALLVPRRLWDARFVKEFEEVAHLAGVTIVGAVLEPPSDEAEYRRVIAGSAGDGAMGLLVGAAFENLAHRAIIARLAIEARLPTFCVYRENVEAGALMGYGPDLADIFRRSVGYMDRILRGATPAEMPFQQPTKFELIINLVTAKALGLTLAPSLLARADEVIE